jgi:hypothetical protein
MAYLDKNTGLILPGGAPGCSGGSDGGSVGGDTSDATAKAADVSAGEVFYGANGRQTGTMQDVTATQSGNVVTVPAGRIRTKQTVTVGTAQAAKTYTPGTIDQTIAAGKYLTGAQTINGDANLKAENIVEGKSIFGVDGAAKVGGSVDFFQCAEVFGPSKVSGFIVSGAGTAAVNGNYLPTDLKTEEDTPIYKHETAEYYYFEMWGEKGITTSPTQYPSEGLYCAYEWDGGEWVTGNGGAEPVPTVTAGNITINANVPKTWNGYKVDTATGTLSQELTTELTYSTRKPVVRGVYSSDAFVKLDYFKISRSGETLIVPLVSNEANALTGQELRKTGDIVLDCGCFYFDNDKSYISADINAHDVLTVTMWVNPNSFAVDLFSLWTTGDENLSFCQGNEGTIRVYADSAYDKVTAVGEKPPVARNFWRHYAIVVYNNKFKAFLNSEYLGEVELPDGTTGRSYTSCRIHGVGFSLADSFHRVRDFRVYGRELTEAEISAIAAENNPVK